MADIGSQVEFYFRLGFNHSDILMSLAFHHIIIMSVRSLRRYIANMQLYRSKNYSNILDVAIFIIKQVEKVSYTDINFYHLKCIQHGFVVNQENVRLLL